jgi:hypothetical protein
MEIVIHGYSDIWRGGSLFMLLLRSECSAND